MAEEWRPDNEAIDVAKIEDLQIIFSEVKIRVEESAEEAERLYQRSITLLTICIAALSGIIAYIWAESLDLSMQGVNIVAVIVLLVLASFKLKRNVTPERYSGLGTQANKLFVKDFFTNLGARTSEWYLLYNLIKDYQRRFTENKEINLRRAERIKNGITLVFYIPLLSGCIWFIMLLFNLR